MEFLLEEEEKTYTQNIERDADIADEFSEINIGSPLAVLQDNYTPAGSTTGKTETPIFSPAKTKGFSIFDCLRNTQSSTNDQGK